MKILLVEDDPKIVDLLTEGLTKANYLVDSKRDGELGWEALQKNKFDLVVLDLMMPGLDGLTLLERMRKQKIETPVIILSAKHSLEDKLAGLNKGGDDYLVKPFAFAELLARIQTLLRRTTTAASTHTQLQFADLVMNLETREVLRGGQKIDLQLKEFSLLQYLLQNAGTVVTKALILEKIWGYDFDPQTNVVDVLVCRLRNKLDKDFSEKLIQTQRGVGYVLRKH